MPMNRIVLLVLLCWPVLLGARDFYLTPEGSGRRNGAAWEDALDQAALSDAFDQILKPGDCLWLGGGVYTNGTLRISIGGTPGLPKTVAGVDRGSGLPVLAGTWTEARPAQGRTAIRIDPGASDCIFRNLKIERCAIAVHAPGTGTVGTCSNLVFRNVTAEWVRHGFLLQHCDDVHFTECEVKHYTKHAFRFDQGCDRIRLARAVADCSGGDAEWEKKTEVFPFGFLLNDAGEPNTGFTFESCTAANNRMPLQENRYKNGDGFVVEQNSSNIVFLRCRALRNQDGGFDLKPDGVTLTNCVAVGNSRAYRLWRSAELQNCFAGWGATGLWCNGGPVNAVRCTFHRMDSAAVMTDDDATFPVTLKRCIISLAGQVSRKTGAGEVRISDSVVTGPGHSDPDPVYRQPSDAWSGLDDSMNSRAYKDKGYAFEDNETM